jgi:penicillin amidase
MRFRRWCLLTIAVLAFAGLEGQSQHTASDLERKAEQALSQISGTVAVEGLSKPVEVLRDTWGIPHIFAQTTPDLFLAQGFVVAQDRMWQLEIWKRTGEGRLAEILGPSGIQQDTFARLLRYRSNWDAEYRSYHPQGREIIEAFVNGINAAIDHAADHLPIEFQITGLRPQRWTAETVVSRMAGFVMTRNAASEVWRAQMVKALGTQKVENLTPLNPVKKLQVPEGLDLEGINASVLSLFPSRTEPLKLKPVESNNWVVDGTKTNTGKPLLANDPHRPILNPSLRYISHLVAPGWNVLGAGEPALPGIATGHNDRIAWGITILGIDQQDLYVEETDPQDPDRYRSGDAWLQMQIEKESIPVKGQAPVDVTLKFTRHGPVVHEDPQRHRAYSLRWVGSEPGAAGYLGALSIHQARNWKEFQRGVEQWKLPSLNLVYGDVDGNIGYHGVGLTPFRKIGDGLLPVPGSTLLYEWERFLPMSVLPHYLNPPQHFIATANHNVIPQDYPHILGYELGPSFRYDRIVEVLKEPRSFTIEDFEKLQHDFLSLPARALIPMLKDVKTGDPELRQALDLLLEWNYWVGTDLPAAAIYEFWFQKLQVKMYRKRVPEEAWDLLEGKFSVERVIEWLKTAEPERDRVLLESLREALADLKVLMGTDMKKWRWGAIHVVEFNHSLAGSEPLKVLFNPNSVARNGDGFTVGNTGGGKAENFQQRTGASYRHILDLADWDRSVGTSVPGQSGQPRSPHYADLIDYWGENRYFPLLFSRSQIEKNTKNKLMLVPSKSGSH